MGAEERAAASADTSHLRIQHVLLGAAGGVVVGAVLDSSLQEAVVPLLLGAALLVTAAVGAVVAGPQQAVGTGEVLRTGFVPDSRVDWWRHYALEFERSRRYDHPLALIAVGCSRQSDPEIVLGRIATHLRRLDSAWLDGHRVLLLLPESDRATAESLVHRLHAVEPDSIPLDGIRVAAFPEDALTSAALLDRVAAPGMLALDPGGRSTIVPERMRRVAHLASDPPGSHTSDPAA